MKTFTETGLITEVNKFYKGALYFEKALKIYEIEFGYTPKIIETENIINEDFIANSNYPDFVTTEALSFMKELQDSGAVNMFGATPYIQNALMLDKGDATELLLIYMKDYTKIYYPEQTL